MSLNAAWAALRMAVAGIPGVTVYTDPGANIDPPAVVLGLPDLSGNGTYSTPLPNELTLHLYLVVTEDDTAQDRLVKLLDQLSEVVFDATDFVVTQAQPGTWQTSNTDLPCYVLTVEGNVS